MPSLSPDRPLSRRPRPAPSPRASRPSARAVSFSCAAARAPPRAFALRNGATPALVMLDRSSSSSSSFTVHLRRSHFCRMPPHAAKLRHGIPEPALAALRALQLATRAAIGFSRRPVLHACARGTLAMSLGGASQSSSSSESSPASPKSWEGLCERRLPRGRAARSAALHRHAVFHCRQQPSQQSAPPSPARVQRTRRGAAGSFARVLATAITYFAGHFRVRVEVEVHRRPIWPRGGARSRLTLQKRQPRAPERARSGLAEHADAGSRGVAKKHL